MNRNESFPPLFPEESIASLRASLRAEVSGAPEGIALVSAYRANYGIPAAAEITERMVLEHWKLERELTRGLLASEPASRAEAFHDAYARLYRSLPWLNRGDDEETPWEAVLARDFLAIIGPVPQRILELGSGRARIARRLADAGHLVRASDVAEERRPHWIVRDATAATADTAGDTSRDPGVPHRPADGSHRPLEWSLIDAIRPDEAAPPASYDVVLSNQMIEHLHPDDLRPHFEGVRRLLRSGGRYVFTTPHAYLGPADLSRVYGAKRPMGMHLREYTVRDLDAAARTAGFDRVEAGFRPPLRLARLVGGGAAMRASGGYRAYLETLEAILALLPAGVSRRAGARLFRLFLFREVPLVAHRWDRRPERPDAARTTGRGHGEDRP